jgi:hypothetical protein
MVCLRSAVAVDGDGGGGCWAGGQFPAKTSGRIQLENSFPPKRGDEFNLNIVSRQMSGRIQLENSFPPRREEK